MAIKVKAPKGQHIQHYSMGAGYVDLEFTETDNCCEAIVTDEATIERVRNTTSHLFIIEEV